MQLLLLPIVFEDTAFWQMRLLSASPPKDLSLVSPKAYVLMRALCKKKGYKIMNIRIGLK